MPVHKLSFSNDLSSPVTLWLEPWGEDYVMLPAQTFEVVAQGTTEGFYFHVAYRAENIQIYAEGSSESVLILQNGELLECGHNRQKI